MAVLGAARWIAVDHDRDARTAAFARSPGAVATGCDEGGRSCCVAGDSGDEPRIRAKLGPAIRALHVAVGGRGVRPERQFEEPVRFLPLKTSQAHTAQRLPWSVGAAEQLLSVIQEPVQLRYLSAPVQHRPAHGAHAPSPEQ